MKKRSKFRCPCCNRFYYKCGRAVSTTLRFCVCTYCLIGIWIDIATGKDTYGRLYSTNRYTYCKCRPAELELKSSPIRCKKCGKLIHADKIRNIRITNVNK